MKFVYYGTVLSVWLWSTTFAISEVSVYCCDGNDECHVLVQWLLPSHEKHHFVTY